MDPTTVYYTRNNTLGFPTRSLFEESAEKVVVSTYCCNVDDTESLAVRTDDTIFWKDIQTFLDTPRPCPCERETTLIPQLGTKTAIRAQQNQQPQEAQDLQDTRGSQGNQTQQSAQTSQDAQVALATQPAPKQNRKHAVFQVTWVPLADDLVNTYMHSLAPESGVVPLVEKLGFTNMRNRLSTACFSLFTGAMRSQLAPDVRQYGLGLFDTPMYMAWDYNETTEQMRAVCWGRPPSHRELDRSLFALTGNSLRHPLAPAVISALTIYAATAETFNTIFIKLRDVEASTGYHSFRKFRDQDGTEQLDFRSLSHRASSTKSSLAASNDAVQALADGVDLIYATLAKPSASPPVTPEDLALAELRLCLENIKHGLQALRTRRESMLIRTEAQITAVSTSEISSSQGPDTNADQIFHLITQEDTKRSIQLAESSTALAADSRALAEAASRDAKAMKTLAVVTMVYLPPTAIATVFGMPFFNWDNKSSNVKGTFWIYWATAIPLTVLTLLVWWAWIRTSDDFKTIIERIEAKIRSPNDDGSSSRSSSSSRRKSRSPDSTRKQEVGGPTVAGAEVSSPTEGKATTSVQTTPAPAVGRVNSNGEMMAPNATTTAAHGWRSRGSRKTPGNNVSNA